MSTPARPRRIATEEAYAIPELYELYREIERAGSRNLDVGVLHMQLTERTPLGANLLDLDRQRIASMDACGIDMQVLALTSPGVQILERADAVRIAALANDRLAEAVARHPGRYAGLAAFAPQDPQAAVAEMERAVTRLGLNGFIVNSHTQNEYLDELKFWPILEAAEALDRPIYIHPRAPADTMAEPFRKGVMYGPIWGYMVEVSVHLIRMIMGRVFDRFPKLKIVIGHMGENIPYYLWRMDHWYRPKDGMRISEVFSRNVWITTSGAQAHPGADEALRYCIRTLGPERILWAVDYPWQDNAPCTEWMNAVDIDEGDRARIFHRNAEALFHIAP